MTPEEIKLLVEEHKLLTNVLQEVVDSAIKSGACNMLISRYAYNLALEVLKITKND